MESKIETRKAAEFSVPQGKKRKYKRRIALVAPLDYEILGQLPPEGATLGFHTMGVTATGIAEELHKTDPTINGLAVSGRLQSMRKLKLTTTVAIIPAGRGMGWQITPEGAKVLNEWRTQSVK